MRRGSQSMRLKAGIAIYLTAALSALGGAPVKRTLVELGHDDDDGLSQRLTFEVASAFERSSDFTPGSGKKSDTLIVTVPHNVHWTKKSGRTKALYTVEYPTVEGQSLGTRSGSCWEDEPARCASRIVEDARGAARKMRGQRDHQERASIRRAWRAFR